jgi:ADP-Ribosyltransferase in polyvalent proteins
MRLNDASLSDLARFSGSCVVDSLGKALTLYHGTPVGERNGMTIGDITSFDRLYTQKMFGRAPGIDQVGSWFSDNPGSKGAGMYTPDSSGVMYPVHLAIKNPWEVSFSGLKRQMNKHSDAPMDKWNDARPTEKGVNGLRAYLAEVGFDGIKILHDKHAENGSTEFENQNVWIALEPEQVIFAIGSNLNIDLGQAVIDLASETMQTSEAKRIDVFIPKQRMGEFLRTIEGIQAQARKLSLPPWEVIVGETQFRLLKNVYPLDLYPGRLDSADLQIEGSYVCIVGQAPVLDGWRFLAKIEHGDGGNLVKRMVGGDSSPAEWHTCGPDCDHCGVSRERKNTYMLQSVDTGLIKHVGSSCVSDFLGQQQRDPDRIAAMFEHVMGLEREFEYDPDKEMTGRGSPCGVEPEKLMAAVLKIVQEDAGYLSAEKAESLHCMSTGERLRSAFWDKKPVQVKAEFSQIEQAPNVVSWLKNQKSSDSLWLRNIAYLADRPAITCKDAALFASGYVAWNRELQKQLLTERGSGEWIGEAGGKITKSATLERRAGYENAYGLVSVLSFRDEEGNGLVWKTQSPPRGLVVGSAYHLTATVKAHGEFGGDKQTEVIRVKVAELELFSFGPLPGFKKFAALATADIGDECGHTPLLKAVMGDELSHALLLLENGADASQVNQGEVPVLSYAASPEMATALLKAGARAVDVTDEWLQGMTAEARAVVVAALPMSVKLPAVVEPAVEQNLVHQGIFSGRIVGFADGVVTQKVNREGATVQHAASKLTMTVEVGDVVDIGYSNGQGVVSGLAKGVGVGR